MPAKKPDNFVPEEGYPPGHHLSGKRRCQKWSYRKERQCMALAMRGMDCCRVHGGLSPKGIASGRASSLRYSKYLPKRLLERYTEASRDKALLELRDEISLCDARIADLLQRVDVGEASAIWVRAKEVMQKLKKAITAGDREQQAILLIELDQLLGRGAGDYAAWDDVRQMIALRVRLVESERKRMLEMQLFISAEEAGNYYRALAEAVKRNVTDPSILRKVQQDFCALTEGK